MVPAPTRQRLPPEVRLEALAAAGSKLLMRTSFKRLQMADVATEMGVAVGTVYRYVDSKDALLTFVLRWTIDGPWVPEQLPLAVQSVEQTAEWLRTRLDSRDFPLMNAALSRRHVEDPHGEIAGVTGELFSVFDRTRGLAGFLALSGRDFPPLAVVFIDVRDWLFERFERYISARIADGQFRPGLDPHTGAHLLVETVGWAALRRTEWPTRGTLVSKQNARAATVEFAVHTFVPD